jgi:hypothetical protein
LLDEPLEPPVFVPVTDADVDPACDPLPDVDVEAPLLSLPPSPADDETSPDVDEAFGLDGFDVPEHAARLTTVSTEITNEDDVRGRIVRA